MSVYFDLHESTRVSYLKKKRKKAQSVTESVFWPHSVATSGQSVQAYLKMLYYIMNFLHNILGKQAILWTESRFFSLCHASLSFFSNFNNGYIHAEGFLIFCVVRKDNIDKWRAPDSQLFSAWKAEFNSCGLYKIALPSWMEWS